MAAIGPIGVSVNECKRCDKLNKAMDIYKTLSWGSEALSYNKETEEILLAEEQIIRIIQMVNPAQKPRKIRLVSQDELWK
ncbi:MAG: hypothetical protein ACYC21_14660 [Eubacteriales bacterium]